MIEPTVHRDQLYDVLTKQIKNSYVALVYRVLIRNMFRWYDEYRHTHNMFCCLFLFIILWKSLILSWVVHISAYFDSSYVHTTFCMGKSEREREMCVYATTVCVRKYVAVSQFRLMSAFLSVFCRYYYI